MYFMTLPSAADLTSPRFVFSYVYVIVCGLLSIYLAYKRYIKLPMGTAVIFTAMMAVMLPLIKIYLIK